MVKSLDLVAEIGGTGLGRLELDAAVPQRRLDELARYGLTAHSAHRGSERDLERNPALTRFLLVSGLWHGASPNMVNAGFRSSAVAFWRFRSGLAVGPIGARWAAASRRVRDLFGISSCGLQVVTGVSSRDRLTSR
jgi:hypothetical protein